MNDRQKLGKAGEDAACRFLQKNDCRILARNYKTKVGETDIIFTDKGILCFCEVKTRKTTNYGLPCEAVNSKRIARLRRNAQWFISEKKYPESVPLRFDVIEILLQKSGTYIRHIKDAF